MVAGVIFRIINPTISNETDKTRTYPDLAVLFHLPSISAGMNLIAHLLSVCKHFTSISTDEAVSEFTLDSEMPPTPLPKIKAKAKRRPRFQTAEPPLATALHPQR